MIVLKVLAIVAGIALLAAAALGFRFRGILRALLAGGAPTPSEVDLKGIDEPGWVRKKRGRKEVEAFEAAGFQRIGAFEIEGIPGAQIVGFVHVQERRYGVVYRHPAAGMWSDVVMPYEDGSVHMASSAPSGGEIDQPPWTHNRYEPGAGVPRLIELGREAPREGRRATSANAFARDFTEEYARAMTWRNERGGVTLSEVERVAEASGMGLAEGEADVALAQFRREMVERIRTECLEKFMAGSGLSALDARDIEASGAVVIHDQMNAGEVIDELCLMVDMPDEALALLEGRAAEGGPPRELFEALARGLPQGMSARKVGSVLKPVGADVWVVHFDEPIS